MTELRAIDRRILGDSGTSAECADNMHVLCDEIGPRFAGTEGYRRAAEFMLSRFKRYRLEDVALEPFEFTAWRRGEPAEFVMKSPLERAYPCYMLPYSACTAAGGVEAEIVDIGSGSDEEFNAKKREIKGRLVLTTSQAGHRTEICERCAELGAVGFVFSAGAEGMGLPTGTVANGEPAAIPAIGIAMETALQIGRLASKGTLRFVLKTDCRCETATTWNVVGELKGSEHPDELVIMGGHLDSHEIGPCAMDNAAGAVQVMETARLLAKQRKHLKRTVRFVGFAGEEVGLLGSHEYAKKHSKALRKARFMLNSDCPVLARPKGLKFHGYAEVKPYIDMLSREMNTPVAFRTVFHRHSDHYPFVLKGVPTAGMGGGPFGTGMRHYVHMEADTVDKISLTDLREGAAFAAQILLRAANDERWPCKRRTPAQVKRLLAT